MLHKGFKQKLFLKTFLSKLYKPFMMVFLMMMVVVMMMVSMFLRLLFCRFFSYLHITWIITFFLFMFSQKVKWWSKWRRGGFFTHRDIKQWLRVFLWCFRRLRVTFKGRDFVATVTTRTHVFSLFSFIKFIQFVVAARIWTKSLLFLFLTLFSFG